MATLSDLRLKDRLFMKAYRYRSAKWKPGATLDVPLSEACVAVVTTSALYLPDQEPFDEEVKGGDYSFREIPLDSDIHRLELGHRSSSFDPEGLLKDKNLVLPFDRLREMASEGEIGAVHSRHFSFMGSITAPGRLLSETAPEVAGKLRDDQVDAVLLTPV